MLLLTLLSLLVVDPLVDGYAGFQLKIPNGEYVPHPCKPNYIYHGVGHVNPQGGGPRNPFGLAFKDANYDWKTVCPLDTDGDGMTNGEELGDPDCEWDAGELPKRTSYITHPGVCDPWDSEDCRSRNTWIDCDPENDFKCDAFNETGVQNFTVRFPPTSVPSTETNYYCMLFELPQNGDFHIVGSTPHIDNKYVMHHILVYGCDESEGPVTEALNKPEPCSMGNAKCNSMISGWGVGDGGECHHKDVGFRIGTNGFRKAMIQFHWNNPELRSDYVDSSGMNLYYTANRRPNDAGVLMIGQFYLEIPPFQNRVEVVGTCAGECTRKSVTSPIKITAALNHMHYLGIEMKIEQYRGGSRVRYITNQPVYNYDTPVDFTFDEPIEFLPGDELKTTCVFKSSNKATTTLQGEGTFDEMCYGFLTYYPKQAVTTGYCGSWKNLPTCKVFSFDYPVVDNCLWHDIINFTHPYTVDLMGGVLKRCVPYGPCVPDCMREIEAISNHPCINTDIGDFLKFQAYNNKMFNHLRFFAGLNSCNAEKALLNRRPCNCKDCHTKY